MANVDLTDELSEFEREQLAVVMKKAKEFQIEEEKHLLRQRVEGYLLKFTNLVKGYQYRWFVLNPDLGTLEYYEKEENKKIQRPRGSLVLTHAVICPSDEDSQTFVLNASNGEIFRLKAADARDRQHWVNRLRAVAEFFTDHDAAQPKDVAKLAMMAHADTKNSVTSRSADLHPKSSRRSKATPHMDVSTASTQSLTNVGLGGSLMPSLASDNISLTSSKSLTNLANGLNDRDPFKNVTELINDLNAESALLSSGIDCFPQNGPNITAYDKSLLLIKATSKATISCLEKCLHVLKTRRAMATAGLTGVPRVARGGSADWVTNETGSVMPSDPVLVTTSSATSPSRTMLDTETRNPSRKGSTSSIGSAGGAPLPGMPLPVPDMDVHPIQVNYADDIEDEETYDEEDLGSVEEHKSVILHMVSQLKLGMDLTKVVLPTFILEKRSLLEMFADCMAHPDLFLKIPDHPDPESRMMAVLEWYLTSFHAGRKGAIAKKPYNPIIGETFHCSWRVPAHLPNASFPVPPQTPTATSSSVFHDSSSIHTPPNVNSHSGRPNSSTNHASPANSPSPSLAPPSNTPPPRPSTAPIPQLHTPSSQPSNRSQHDSPSKAQVLLSFTAEQVSHHPPVTAFHFECPEKKIYMNASIYTKSKFQGMTICAAMIGKLSLYLADKDEEYIFTLPSAYARSILTVPWVELGDKISITCGKTKFSSSVTFHTKPFYGGKLHKITAEVRNPSGGIVAKVQGEWNGIMDVENVLKNERRVIDVSQLTQQRKRVPPLSKQRPQDSRRLWHKVTEALRRGDINRATECKRELEERQRASEKYRKEHKIGFPVKYFVKSGDTWVYRK